MTRGNLGGAIGSRQRKIKQVAYSPDAYELLVLRIISWRQAPNPAVDLR